MASTTTTASTSLSYISIRDDSSLRSFSSNERSFLRAGALNGAHDRVLRVDGRGPGELRKIQLSLKRSSNTSSSNSNNGQAECTVQWGETRVSACVAGTMIVPPPDRPSEGMINITVDASPMASPGFGMMPPTSTGGGGGSAPSGQRPDFASTATTDQKMWTNRILRCLERIIILGGALDTEALCIQPGAWVWKLDVTVKILNHAGNLLDASVLAAMAALRHYRKPHAVAAAGTDATTTSTSNHAVGGMPEVLHADVREPTPLPLHHSPLTLSFCLVHENDVALSTSSTLTVAVLVDPTEREELIGTGVISMAMNVHQEVCLLDFGGGCELKPAQLKSCWRLARDCIPQLCQLLETSLTQADEQALKERLQRLQLQQQQQQQQQILPPLTGYAASSEPPPHVPFWSSQDDEMEPVDTATITTTETTNVIQSAAERVYDQEQERYRRSALEYNQGHVAAKVKDNDKTSRGKKKNNKSSSNNSSTLLAAMMKSVTASTNHENNHVATMTTRMNDVVAKSMSKAKGTTVTTNVGTVNKSQREQQQDEFNEFVQKQKKKTKKDDDDDEEEEEPAVMLQTEFQSVAIKETDNQQSNNKGNNNDNGADDDVDDLAMAIKGKKKKKTKKGK